MDKEQEEYLKLIIDVINWFDSPEKVDIVNEDIIKKCKESKLPDCIDFCLGDEVMKNKIELILNYDFDQEQGYNKKSMILDGVDGYVYKSLLNDETKIVINLYPEDIEELLEGTGMSLDG